MGFLSNLFGGKTSEVEQSATEDGRTAEASPQTAPVATVLCPVSGTVMDISEVNDPVFAGKAMGDGIAIVRARVSSSRLFPERWRPCSQRATRSLSRTKPAWESCFISASIRST